MSQRRGAILPGLILILVGGWLLAQNLGVALPGLDQLWPAFPLIGGLAFILQFFLGERKDDGLIFVGVAAALVGAFFFAFTLGPLSFDEGDMAGWWPVFVLIGAAAFLAQWLVRPRQWGLLVPAGLALLVGLIALAATQRRFSPELLEQIVRLWPLTLIIGGLASLASYLIGRRRES